MLILSRRPRQSITIFLPSGEKIKITFERTAYGRSGKKTAFIGIDAPRHIVINRDDRGASMGTGKEGAE